MASSSSSFSLSSRDKKTSKYSQIEHALFKKPNSSSSSSRATSLIKRRETIFKKAGELETLCGNEVCVICYGPGGELNTFPRDRKTVEKMAKRYYGLSDTKRRKARVNLSEFLEKMSKDGSKKTKLNLGSNLKKPDLDMDGYSEEKLTEVYQYLKHHHTRINHKIRTVQEQRNKNMAYQAQMITTAAAAAMNHLQQQSNQVSNSMHPFNYGNGTLSQIPVSASAFNQGQSLALMPSQLPNWNVGDHSGLLGSQDPWFNEFENPNMYHCNSFNYNNVEDYSSLLRIQGPEINTITSMATYDNSNTNGLSQQLVQYPTQATAAPGFQFGSFNSNY